jgi:hypothetical protein
VQDVVATVAHDWIVEVMVGLEVMIFVAEDGGDTTYDTIEEFDDWRGLDVEAADSTLVRVWVIVGEGGMVDDSIFDVEGTGLTIVDVCVMTGGDGIVVDSVADVEDVSLMLLGVWVVAGWCGGPSSDIGGIVVDDEDDGYLEDAEDGISGLAKTGFGELGDGEGSGNDRAIEVDSDGIILLVWLLVVLVVEAA